MPCPEVCLHFNCYDKEPDDISLPNVLRQCLNLISVFPLLSVYGYQAYNHYVCGKSLYIHNPKKELSTAENILRMLRPDKKYSHLEAKILDLALILHMEHGGGNNSTFTNTRCFLIRNRHLFCNRSSSRFSERSEARWCQY